MGLTIEEQTQKARRFATGAVGFVALCSGPETLFRQGYFPTVRGERVNCGDAHPTPDGGFETPGAAKAAARTYKKLCRDFLVKHETA